MHDISSPRDDEKKLKSTYAGLLACRMHAFVNRRAEEPHWVEEKLEGRMSASVANQWTRCIHRLPNPDRIIDIIARGRLCLI